LLCISKFKQVATMNKVEQWKQEKHGFDVWQDMLDYAEKATPFQTIDKNDLERMKWYGVLNRKRDASGRFMLRYRLTGCELTAKQAREMAFVAYEYGHGIVDITTRAGIQVQGLAIENVPAALLRLEACGLTAKQTGHDNVRSVFCHPLSGVDPDELFDTRALCRDITDLILDSRTYADLPKKFNIALNGRTEHGSHYWTQDLSYLACEGPDGNPMFQVLVGGTQGQQPKLGEHLPVLVAPEQVVEVTRVILDLFREQGFRENRNRGRFRFLIEKIGINGVLTYLEEHLPYPLLPCASEPPPPTGYDELIGWFRQQQPKLWSMGVSVPLGRMSWQQLEGMSLLAKKWGDGSLRATSEQGLLVVNIPAGFKDAAATDAAALGLSVHADTLVRNTVACTGSQFCNIAVTETKGQMLKLIDKLRQRGTMLHGIRMHMSGCPSSCAQHFTADIGLKGVRVRRLLGSREGFDVYLGGGIAGKVRLAKPYRLGVDIDQLPQLIADVVQEYYRQHKAGQTFSTYWREKLLKQEASKVGDSEYTPPTWLCEGCGYQHRAEYPPVFCPSCAGLRKLFARLEGKSPDDES
jgi:ferredoxin-nitrite reductase